MKAKDLIKLLKSTNPESEVYVVTNLEFPSQKKIQKILKRSDLKEEHEESKYKKNSDILILADKAVSVIPMDLSKLC